MLAEDTVDIYMLGDNLPEMDWDLGIVQPFDAEKLSLDLKHRPSGFILFWDSQIGYPNHALVQELIESNADLWHAGLKLGMQSLPGLIDFVAPLWMLNRDPERERPATSWRVSFRACLVRKSVLEQIGFLDPNFQTLNGAALEWGHRCVRSGVITRHVPALVPNIQRVAPQVLPFVDELRFVLNRFGLKWAVWAFLRAMLSGYVRLAAGLLALKLLGWVSPPNYHLPYRRKQPSTTLDVRLGASSQVTVLVPTLDRYAYLKTLLMQLRDQTVPPGEVIIIDQTPVEKRQAAPYAEFSDLPIKVIFRDQSGQCSSRNAGLKAASGEYVLFIDDDDEVPANLIETHLINLQDSLADASCGVADEAGAGPLPLDFTFYRVSDVFPTNNTMIRRKVLSESGLFDLAYERGQRADGDLGMRVYLSGALMILNPKISVFHHHAPRGGLRAHKARVITYASSRRQLTHRHLLSVSDFYLAQRYFSPRQAREVIWLCIWGTFSLHGSGWRKFVKITLGLVYLPDTLFKLRSRQQAARRMLEEYPQIPTLEE